MINTDEGLTLITYNYKNIDLTQIVTLANETKRIEKFNCFELIFIEQYLILKNKPVINRLCKIKFTHKYDFINQLIFNYSYAAFTEKNKKSLYQRDKEYFLEMYDGYPINKQIKKLNEHIKNVLIENELQIKETEAKEYADKLDNELAIKPITTKKKNKI